MAESVNCLYPSLSKLVATASLNNIHRNRSSNSLQIWQQTKIPDNFCEVGDLCLLPAQKIQRVHNRVSGSLVTEDAI